MHTHKHTQLSNSSVLLAIVCLCGHSLLIKLNSNDFTRISNNLLVLSHIIAAIECEVQLYRHQFAWTVCQFSSKSNGCEQSAGQKTSVGNLQWHLVTNWNSCGIEHCAHHYGAVENGCEKLSARRRFVSAVSKSSRCHSTETVFVSAISKNNKNHCNSIILQALAPDVHAAERHGKAQNVCQKCYQREFRLLRSAGSEYKTENG